MIIRIILLSFQMVIILPAVATNSHEGDFNAVHGSYDAFLMKTDKAGKIIWTKTYGGRNAEAFQHVREEQQWRFGCCWLDEFK